MIEQKAAKEAKEAKEAKGTIWEPIYKSPGKPCFTSREKNSVMHPRVPLCTASRTSKSKCPHY